MLPTDRERRLQSLAAENARWAEEELRLLTAIRENNRRLEQLPAIIRRLNEKRAHAEAEMKRTGAAYDALEAENSDAEFRAWVNDMADDYADFQLTTQPPRPNPFGLFRR